MHNIVSTGMNFAKKKYIWLSVCLLAVLGLQGMVVICTAATVFCNVDCDGSSSGKGHCSNVVLKISRQWYTRASVTRLLQWFVQLNNSQQTNRYKKRLTNEINSYHRHSLLYWLSCWPGNQSMKLFIFTSVHLPTLSSLLRAQFYLLDILMIFQIQNLNL